MVREWCVLHILTWNCASRHHGVQFFHIPTSKSGGGKCAPRRATAAGNFATSELPKVVRECVLYILTWKCASRHSCVQFFISLLNSYLRTRRFREPTFRPSGTTNHWKNIAIRDFPNISRDGIFFLLAFARLYFLASDSTSLLYFPDSTSLPCFSSLHIVGS